jgi:hypothetical protein
VQKKYTDINDDDDDCSDDDDHCNDESFAWIRMTVSINILIITFCLTCFPFQADEFLLIIDPTRKFQNTVVIHRQSNHCLQFKYVLNTQGSTYCTCSSCFFSSSDCKDLHCCCRESRSVSRALHLAVNSDNCLAWSLDTWNDTSTATIIRDILKTSLISYTTNYIYKLLPIITI